MSNEFDNKWAKAISDALASAEAIVGALELVTMALTIYGLQLAACEAGVLALGKDELA
jgi:hypothetical protein